MDRVLNVVTSLRGLFLGGLAGIFLVGCQTTSDPNGSMDVASQGNYKVGKPYQVAGVWYYPREDINYDETGLASWYGNEFKGRPTANGEVYDPGLLTAAHKTLPMPVMARVTNLENGNQIVVRINDRGPFVHGRVIDLSEQSARLLGFREKGVAKVRVEYLGKAIKETRYVAKAAMAAEERKVANSAPVNDVASDDLAPPPGATVATDIVVPDPVTPELGEDDYGDVRNVRIAGPKNIYVQAGSFSLPDNAVRLKSQLERSGYNNPGVVISTAKIDGLQFYRVQVGPIFEVDYADQVLETMLSSGYVGSRIIVQ